MESKHTEAAPDRRAEDGVSVGSFLIKFNNEIGGGLSILYYQKVLLKKGAVYK